MESKESYTSQEIREVYEAATQVRDDAQKAHHDFVGWYVHLESTREALFRARKKFESVPENLRDIFRETLEALAYLENAQRSDNKGVYLVKQ